VFHKSDVQITKSDFSLRHHLTGIDISPTGPYAPKFDNYSQNRTLFMFWRLSIEAGLARRVKLLKLSDEQREQELSEKEGKELLEVMGGEQLDEEEVAEQMQLWEWHAKHLTLLIDACETWRDRELIKMQETGEWGKEAGKLASKKALPTAKQVTKARKAQPA
jgi:hypothetical protein